MPHTEFVKNVRFRGGEVGDNQIRAQQLFIHGEVNQPSVDDLVGAERNPVQPPQPLA